MKEIEEIKDELLGVISKRRTELIDGMLLAKALELDCSVKNVLEEYYLEETPIGPKLEEIDNPMRLKATFETRLRLVKRRESRPIDEKEWEESKKYMICEITKKYKLEPAV